MKIDICPECKQKFLVQDESSQNGPMFKPRVYDGPIYGNQIIVFNFPYPCGHRYGARLIGYWRRDGKFEYRFRETLKYKFHEEESIGL